MVPPYIVRLSSLSVHDEGCSRNGSCALNSISTVLFSNVHNLIFRDKSVELLTKKYWNRINWYFVMDGSVQPIKLLLDF